MIIRPSVIHQVLGNTRSLSAWSVSRRVVSEGLLCQDTHPLSDGNHFQTRGDITALSVSDTRERKTNASGERH